MGTNYWMFVETSENAEITRKMGYTLFGMGPRYKKRAQRMQKRDRVVFYNRATRTWTASATISSECFEDDSLIWMPKSRAIEFKFRIELKPNYILDESQYLDGLQIGPGLEYVKRWSPEHWPLAFWDKLHLIPQRDFKLLEGEMIRIKTGKPGETYIEDHKRHKRAHNIGRKRRTDQSRLEIQTNTDPNENSPNEADALSSCTPPPNTYN